VTSAETLIAQGRRFEFYAKYLWRFHRPFVARALSRRCRNCVVSEVYSPLDKNGVCGRCREHDQTVAGPVPKAGANPALIAELDALLRQSQGSGVGGHDALVMLSGGKDSALLIHELQRRYTGLRLLAITIDNSFMSPVALENVRRIVETLDVDHVTLRPPRSLYVKSFRMACTLNEPGKGCFETVDRIDADLGFSLAKIYAATHRIPLLLSGLSWAQVELLFGVRSFEVPPAQALQRVDATLGRPIDQAYDASEKRYWWDPDRFAAGCGPRFVHPFYVWRYEEQEIQNRVIALGLIEKGNDSPLLTNNTIIPMMIVSDYLRLGYASFEPEFSDQVRAGKADPRFWRNVFEMLEYAARTGWMLGDEIEKIAQSLGLTREALGLTPSRQRPVLARRWHRSVAP